MELEEVGSGIPQTLETVLRGARAGSDFQRKSLWLLCVQWKIVQYGAGGRGRKAQAG